MSWAVRYSTPWWSVDLATFATKREADEDVARRECAAIYVNKVTPEPSADSGNASKEDGT